ncbi:MAG: putative exported protein [Pedosphaera sp.]|nr:putative exported protein [Pedosphaera sp.]
MRTKIFWLGMVCTLLKCTASFGQTSSAEPVETRSSLNLDSKLSLESSHGIWKSELGAGFLKGTRDAGFVLGAGPGMRVLASHEAHDLGLAFFHYAWILSDVKGEGRWYRGNWEIRGEAFGGMEFRPRRAYVAGVAPILRYNFATGTRWMPFFDLGAGLSATDIGRPDLSTTFEFNLQTGAGVHYFWRENSALTFQYRFFHLSNAGIERPNTGVNAGLFLAGLSWFF